MPHATELSSAITMAMESGAAGAAAPHLVERLARATDVGGKVVFVSGDGSDTVTWADLHDEALAGAAELQAMGVAPGDHVALLGPTTRALVTAIEAIWLAGATLVVLPLPMRLGSLDEFVAHTRMRIIAADTKLVLADPDLVEAVADAVPEVPAVPLGDVVGGRGSHAYVEPPADPERLAILQFTSGSTSDPKGVMLPERVMLANLDAVCEAGRIRDDDVFVSWLPLYHDMGLVGMLSIPMTTGRTLVLGAPQDFLGSPARWMRWISEHRGTATAGPNFSWVLAARALRREQGLDLSCLRIALNGAEPVDPAAARALVEAGAPHGLRAEAVFPAFGMAEVGIGCTFPVPSTGLRTDVVERDALEGERRAVPAELGSPHVRELVRLGYALPGLELRVVDEEGAPLAPREVGELQVRGTSVTPGYYRDPEATAASRQDGWLRTGDLGYLLGDGELVLCGRIKDLIIVGGRNIFPQDVEHAVAQVEGVRAGNVIAFAVEGGKGKERVAVVAEVRSGPEGPPASEDLDLIRKHAHERALEATGVPPSDVVLVAAGTLPKTSSGKLQRQLCRRRYLDGELSPLG